MDGLFDDPAAEDETFRVVHNHGLPWGESPLALVEGDATGTVSAGLEGAGHAPVVLAHLCEAAMRRVPTVGNAVETEIRCEEAVGEKTSVRPDNDAVVFWVEGQDVERF